MRSNFAVITRLSGHPQFSSSSPRPPPTTKFTALSMPSGTSTASHGYRSGKPTLSPAQNLSQWLSPRLLTTLVLPLHPCLLRRLPKTPLSSVPWLMVRIVIPLSTEHYSLRPARYPSMFEVIRVDNGTEKGVPVLPAYQRYCAHTRTTLNFQPSSEGFHKGDVVHRCLGKAKIRLPVVM